MIQITPNLSPTANPPPQIIATVHIGANAVSMLVGAPAERGDIDPVDFFEQPVPLARDVFRSGQIGRTAMERCVRVLRDYRAARSLIGLVPQELTTDTFETVWATVSFSRGLFGYAPDPAHIEKVLRSLTLWEKRNDKIMTLSGGMKRRVMIAKALAHEPQILFLDEPTAGVDVELRRDMWQLVRGLRESGVTIILTTHYIDEAEEMADRIGVIDKGELIVVEEKTSLMKKLGKKQLTLAS